MEIDGILIAWWSDRSVELSIFGVLFLRGLGSSDSCST